MLYTQMRAYFRQGDVKRCWTNMEKRAKIDCSQNKLSMGGFRLEFSSDAPYLLLGIPPCVIELEKYIL
jgi:hypothetical protein